MMPPFDQNRGFTLIELVIVIVLVGIIATIATRNLGTSIETARYEQTKRELDELARAIVGNPGVYKDGARSDFGYVGDVGALPPDLDALVRNPGGFTTWHGPYMINGSGDTDYKTDGWNVPYVYSDTLLRSTGSGGNIDKLVANRTTDLLANTVEGYVRDANRHLPGAVYKDSLLITLAYPDGAGGTATASNHPDSKGNFAFSGIPIGNHTLRVIYTPDRDTVAYDVCVTPASAIKLDIVFPADLW